MKSHAAARNSPVMRAIAGLWSVAGVVAAALLLTSCAGEELQPDYAGARELIAETTGATEVYDPEQPPLSPDAIEAFLRDGLSLDEALRLALLNSRRLQAGFMGLGIARADFVQAGLLENPTLGLGLLFPSGSGSSRITGGLAQNAMDLLRIPARRRAAAAGMEQQLLALGRQAGELVVDTQTAYFEGVASRRLRVAAEAGADLARRSAEAVAERVDRGVATATDASLARTLALGADLEVRRTRRAEVGSARRLAGLLSLTVDLIEVPLIDALPAAGADLVDRETLVGYALSNRLDLRTADAAIRAAEERVAVARGEALPEVTLGLGYERPEGEDTSVLGPELDLELPVFDGNEAQISRAEFELEQLRRLGEAMVAEAGQQVRAAADQRQLAVATARFVEDEVLPQAERVMALARKAYDGGDTNLLTLLQAETAAITARATLVEARLLAALARVDLERALGGPLPDELRAAATIP